MYVMKQMYNEGLNGAGNVPGCDDIASIGGTDEAGSTSTEQPPDGGTAAMTREHFENLAVAINMGTNLPSCATPNGQAAFLFILTSVIAPLLELTYSKMVWMTLPYTISLTLAGLIGVLTMVYD